MKIKEFNNSNEKVSRYYKIAAEFYKKGAMSFKSYQTQNCKGQEAAPSKIHYFLLGIFYMHLKSQFQANPLNSYISNDDIYMLKSDVS